MLQPDHEARSVATHAIAKLRAQDTSLYIVSQNLLELWVVSTRPVAQNGLGLAPDQAATQLERIKSMFVLLPDHRETFAIWENLVLTHQISGKPAHDAHLAAAMKAHGLRRILTFDGSGFSRFPEIEVLHPARVA